MKPNNPTFDLTCDLLRLESVTPNDETCQDMLIARLTPLGFNCETLISGPDDFRVTNLWAIRRGTAANTAHASAKTFVFAGHTDVVPTGPVTHWQS